MSDRDALLSGGLDTRADMVERLMQDVRDLQCEFV